MSYDDVYSYLSLILFPYGLVEGYFQSDRLMVYLEENSITVQTENISSISLKNLNMIRTTLKASDIDLDFRSEAVEGTEHGYTRDFLNLIIHLKETTYE